MRRERPEQDQGQHGERAMDLHQECCPWPGIEPLPCKARRQEREQGAIQQEALDERQPVHSTLKTCAAKRCAISAARRGSSMHGLVRASAVMQLAAKTVTPNAPPLPPRGSMRPVLAEVATAASRSFPM